MNYFTPERYLALQDCSSDAAMNRADEAWEEAVQCYEAYLRTVRPSLPSPPERRQATASAEVSSSNWVR